MTSMHTSDIRARAGLREQIAAETAEFLSRGREIERVGRDQHSGTRPACAVMRKRIASHVAEHAQGGGE